MKAEILKDQNKVTITTNPPPVTDDAYQRGEAKQNKLCR